MVGSEQNRAILNSIKDNFVTTTINVQTLAKDVKVYSQIVAKFGPDSIKAREFRSKLSDDEEFLAFADSLDLLHQNLRNQKRREHGKRG